MEERFSLMQDIADAFKDSRKASRWISNNHPQLQNYTPAQMMSAGRFEEVKKVLDYDREV